MCGKWSGIDDAYIEDKIMQGRKVADAIRAMVSAKGLSLECARLLQDNELSYFNVK